MLKVVRTWVCTAGGAANARFTFEGDSWLFGRVLFPYEGAIRRTPLEEVGARNTRVGMMLRVGEGLCLDATRHDLTLFRSRHGKR